MQQFEPFTLEDANYVLGILDGLDDAGVVAVDPTQVSFTPTIIPIEEFDIEMVASGLHGITDPIGQLKDWLYDRLKELASWFADTVNAIYEDFYNSFIKPILDSISSVVESI